MAITSLSFLAFVGISLLFYWNLPTKYQWIVLLIDSLIFYFFNCTAITYVYILISSFSVWGATLCFERCESQRVKKSVMILVLLLNVGILAVLKYTNLGINTFNFFARKEVANVSWLAPLAISFYTLQIVAYLLDAYWGVTRIEKNPIKLLLFTTYFPQMISGPINSFESLGNELYKEHRFDYNRVTHGMKRVAWGMVKKLAISNRLEPMVVFLWDDLNTYHGIWVWIAMLLYVFQLYTDFSGCMDIVIGVSECFGIKLVENFKAPLLSKNIQEFWQRWHITLGQWLRDYIMNPLLKTSGFKNLAKKSKEKFGKKKGKKIPVYLAMFFLWTAMGLWHGNSWKYILGEGLWFWFVIVFSQILEEHFKKTKDFLHIKDNLIWKSFQVVRTILIYSFGMLFFRADTLMDSFTRIAMSCRRCIGISNIKQFLAEAVFAPGTINLAVLTISFVAMCVFDGFLYCGIDVIEKLSTKSFVVRWLIYLCVVGIILVSYDYGTPNFAYAQF